MRKPKLALIPLAALVAALALVGCGGSDSSGDVPNDAVAVVGDQEISKQQFDALIAQAQASAKQQKRDFPKAGTPEHKNLQNQGLEYLVRRAEFAQKAEDLDVEVTDKQVDERLEQLKKQFYGGDDKKFRASLEKLLLTEDQVRADVRAQLLEEALYKKVTEDVKVSDKEIEDFYNKNKAQYQQAATREVRHILVKNKAKADALHSQLQGGANFANLAKKNSEDPGSRARAGSSPSRRARPCPRSTRPRSRSRRTSSPSRSRPSTAGTSSSPSPTSRRPARRRSPQVKEAIKQQLVSEKKTTTMREWIEDLKDEFDVNYQVGYAPPSTQTTQTQTTDGE